MGVRVVTRAHLVVSLDTPSCCIALNHLVGICFLLGCDNSVQAFSRCPTIQYPSAMIQLLYIFS